MQIVMALATQTMALAWGRAKLDEGLSQGRLQGEYFGIAEANGIGLYWPSVGECRCRMGIGCGLMGNRVNANASSTHY